MSIRRSLAAVLSVGTLFLATACADDDLDSGSDNADNSTSPSATTSESEPSTSAGGPVTLAGQGFPEATLVAAMYEQLLKNAGYDVTTKLVDSRDGYMATFPGGVDIVPEYVGGIVNFLNSAKNGDNAAPFEAGDGEQLADDGKALLDEAGITLLDISAATDTNAFMVTQQYSETTGHQALRPRGRQRQAGGAPDCEGRLDCEGGLSDQYGIDVTEVLPLGYASDQTYQSVISGESELGETSTTDGTLESQGWWSSRTTSRSSRRKTSCRRSPRVPHRAPGHRQHPQPADGRAHHGEPHRAQRPDRGRPREARGRR